METSPEEELRHQFIIFEFKTLVFQNEKSLILKYEGFEILVEPSGIERLTSTLPVLCYRYPYKSMTYEKFLPRRIFVRAQH